MPTRPWPPPLAIAARPAPVVDDLELERIRAELGSDKVYDVIGQLFQGVSLRDYMRDALTEEGVANVERLLAGTLTAEQVTALQQAEQRRYGDGDDVARELPRLRAELEDETYRRLLPGYVRGFVAEAAPLLGLRIEGDLSARFALHAAEPHAMDPLLSALERYETPQQAALSVVKPDNGEPAIFLRPGESVFEALRQQVMLQLGPAARRGAVFRDAGAESPLPLSPGPANGSAPGRSRTAGLTARRNAGDATGGLAPGAGRRRDRLPGRDALAAL